MLLLPPEIQIQLVNCTIGVFLIFVNHPFHKNPLDWLNLEWEGGGKGNSVSLNFFHVHADLSEIDLVNAPDVFVLEDINKSS